MADFNYTGGVRFAPDKVVDVTADKDGNPTKACNPITGVCLEGGGGDSDFGTAEVTLTNSGEPGSVAAYVLALINVNTELIFNDFSVPAGNPVVIKVPLYKGKCVCPLIVDNIDMEVMPTVTGGVTLDLDNNSVIITGDGGFSAKGSGMN